MFDWIFARYRRRRELTACCMLLSCGVLLCGCSSEKPSSASRPADQQSSASGDAAPQSAPAVETEIVSAENGSTSSEDLGLDLENLATEVITAPGLEERTFVGPLADAYNRIDPTKDGWQTEAFNEAASGALSKLGKRLEKEKPLTEGEGEHYVTPQFVSSPWVAEKTELVFSDAVLKVRRSGDLSVNDSTPGPAGLASAAEQLGRLFSAGHPEHVKFKLYRIEREAPHVATEVLMQASGPCQGGSVEINANCLLHWTENDQEPRMQRFTVQSWEESRYRGDEPYMFVDCTESILGDTEPYVRQYLRSTDYWRSRLPRNLGLDVVANHGLAVGDVNGDGLEDLYYCAQGGLPNRLLLQNRDGTLRDASAESGADWLDYCTGALLVDLDNDGDRDLVIAQEFAIQFMSNDGRGRFQLMLVAPRDSQAFSLTAADYDQDGDLDVYSCGYNPTAFEMRAGAMGEPMPFHDANNGGRNVLLQNEGNWEFRDVTEQVGLDENNRRFSFAAAWEDYDNDGDLDLYVANDYGRNNLYRNEGGRFDDVAGELNVEDVSAGMSVCWGDYDRDGWMDLYISNMFSAAGNRITYQRQFKTDVEDDVRRDYQRLARGNTLFRNTGDGHFVDDTEAAGVWQGRWAWGSRFGDLNGDGWEDLFVANGFITTEDTGDL